MHYLEAEELAIAALGLDDNADEREIDRQLVEEFGVVLEQFQAIAERLIKLTIPARTAITGELCRGFVKDDAFIVKETV